MPIFVKFRSVISEIRRRKRKKKERRRRRNTGKIQFRRHSLSGGL